MISPRAMPATPDLAPKIRPIFLCWEASFRMLERVAFKTGVGPPPWTTSRFSKFIPSRPTLKSHSNDAWRVAQHNPCNQKFAMPNEMPQVTHLLLGDIRFGSIADGKRKLDRLRSSPIYQILNPLHPTIFCHRLSRRTLVLARLCNRLQSIDIYLAA